MKSGQVYYVLNLVFYNLHKRPTLLSVNYILSDVFDPAWIHSYSISIYLIRCNLC